MKIVVIGVGRIPHLGMAFQDALQGMGHSVRLVDELRSYTLLDRWPLRLVTKQILGGKPSGTSRFRNALLRECESFRPDFVLAVKGGTMDVRLIEDVRSLTKAPIAMYSTDNPFNPAASTPQNIENLAHWSAIATPRRDSIPELKKHCGGEVFYLPFGYVPAWHYPEKPANAEEERTYRSDVAFVGGCDRDRVPFLDPLARSEDLNVSLYGGYYNYTPALKKRSKGFAYGRAYRLVLGGAGVALSLVRHANGDGHVMRTWEIPACGAFLLTERTRDHEEMFEEDREAVFFSSPEELLDKSRFYVKNEAARLKIAEGGYRRVTGTPNTYADRLRVILERLF